MKRLVVFAAAMIWAGIASAQVTLTGSVRNASGQGLPITPNGLFIQGCNAGAGGIVGQGGCAIPTDASGGGGGSVSAAAGAFVDGWSVTDGSTTDLVCSTDTGTCTEVSLFKRLNVGISALVAGIGSPIPAGNNVIGHVIVDSSGLPAGAATDALQTSGNTLLSSILAATGVAQGSTTSGQSGPLVQCAVTTSAPTYTTAKTNPLSCDPTGAVRITAPASAPISVTVNTPPNDVLTGPTSVTGASDVAVNSQGSGAAALQITGTFTGLSGVIRGSVDGTNYVNVGSYNANTGAVITAGTAVTATGVYVIPAAGYRFVQYHVTAVATGTAVVNLNSSAGALDPPNSVSAGGKNVNATNFPGTVDTNAGAAGASTLRVVVATGGSALPAGSALIGKVGVDQTTPGTTNNVTVSTNVGTLPLVQATASAAITFTAAGGPTQIIAASGSTKIYITHWDVILSGAGTFALVTGTGSNCGTNTAYLTGASGHPLSFAANGGISAGGGLGPVLITGAGGEVCAITTGAVDSSGSIAYAQF